MRKTVIFAAVAALGLAACTISEGERAGVVSKFSNRGLICPTWEGEMQVGSGLNQAVFTFSVEDPNVVTQVQEALNSGDRVVLHYSQRPYTLPCGVDTQYIITGVRNSE